MKHLSMIVATSFSPQRTIVISTGSLQARRRWMSEMISFLLLLLLLRLRMVLTVANQSCMNFSRISDWRGKLIGFIRLGGLTLVRIELLSLLLLCHHLLLLILWVVSLRQGDLISKYIIDSDSWTAFNFLLCPFLVLFPHMHNSSGRWAVILITVHALVILGYLISHTTMLTSFVTERKCLVHFKIILIRVFSSLQHFQLLRFLLIFKICDVSILVVDFWLLLAVIEYMSKMMVLLLDAWCRLLSADWGGWELAVKLEISTTSMRLLLGDD